MDPYVSGGGRHGGRVSSGRGRGRSERFQRRDQSFEDEWGRSDGFGGPSTRGGRGGGTLGGKRSGGGRGGPFAPDGRERSYDGRNDAPGVGRREDRQSRAGQDKPVREVRSWAQLRALGAPTLSAFKPKPQEVKTRKELDQEKQAQEASASDSSRHWPEGSGVTEHHRTAASSDQAEMRAGPQSLLAFALGEDSLDEPDPPVADGNSELLRPPPALGARIENVYPPARRIAKEVWRPGTGKTLHEDNPEERLAEKRRREEDSRLLAQELLLLGSRDTPWKVLNELGPGLRPYEFSMIIKQLGQRDRQAGWVRALQTFLWLQAHDPGKASNRVYTAVIDSLGRAGQLEIAITLWEDMGRRGIPRDVFITNVMLSTLVRSRDYHAALELFEEVQERGLDGPDSPDVFTYSTIIDACARGGIGLDRALGFFRQMIAAGIDPDIVVCNNILRACSEEGAFGEAANLIDTMKASGLSPNVVSYSILVDAFCKRKELDKAFEVFQEMKREGVPPDFIMYRTLADSLRKQGFIEDAEHLYEEMNRLGLTQSSVTRSRSSHRPVPDQQARIPPSRES